MPTIGILPTEYVLEAFCFSIVGVRWLMIMVTSCFRRGSSIPEIQGRIQLQYRPRPVNSRISPPWDLVPYNEKGCRDCTVF
jgi:hypothetical protein